MAEDRLIIDFTPNTHFTVGVEIEFQILDRKTLDLTPSAPLLLQNSPKLLAPRISHEFIRSILEIQTGICHNVRDVENDLMQTCSMAEELAGDNGCLLYAASLHPFANDSQQIVSADERYERILDELQILGQKFISQGLHVHLGMPDGDTAIRFCNVVQLYLPLLLALSTSSPFSKGVDTGLLSYRTKLFEVLPHAGIYEFVKDWRQFEEDIERLRSYGVIDTMRDLWWDARPNSEFGTVEIRICDLPGRFSDILALVAFIQGIGAYIAAERHEQFPISLQVLQANKWQAVRYGLDGYFIDFSAHLHPQKITCRQAIDLLVQKVKPYVEELGGGEYLEGINRIVDCGTSAHRQKEIYAKEKSFEEVIEQTYQEFWQ